MQIIKKKKLQDFKILNKKTSGIPLRDNGRFLSHMMNRIPFRRY